MLGSPRKKARPGGRGGLYVAVSRVTSSLARALSARSSGELPAQLETEDNLALSQEPFGGGDAEISLGEARVQGRA